MTTADWDSGFGKSLAVFLNGDAIPEPNARGERVSGDSFLLCFNAYDEPLDFVTPDGDYATQWTAVLDTAEPDGQCSAIVDAGKAVRVQDRALVVLRKSG